MEVLTEESIDGAPSVAPQTNYNYIMFVTVTIELGVCAAAHSPTQITRFKVYTRR